MAGPVKHNLKNPAVKRILQEMKEMQNNPSDDYASLPLEDNIFEWQFAIRGPRDTEFEGGIYHGRIQLPPEYPFKPPAFMLLTPNGRFETQTKICLSISQYHPEFWQPSWSVRTALVALIAFMPTKPNGAIGSLEFGKEERQALAIKSCAAAPKFGNEERQKVIDEIHEQMLKKTPMQEGATAAEASHDCSSSILEGGITEHSALEGNFKHEQEDIEVHGDSSGSNTNVDPVTGVLVKGTVAAMEEHDVTTPTPETRAFAGAVSSESIQNVRSELSVPVTRHQSSDDRWLTLLAIALTVALAALLIKKLWNSYRWIGI